jgi:hypothetical protein
MSSIEPVLEWGKQIIGGEERIVSIGFAGRYCRGNWPYSSKEELKRRVIDGDLLFEVPTKRIKTFRPYRTPDPSRYNPTEEPLWTLPMALSWIIWRSVDWVRTQWEYYDSHLRELNRLNEAAAAAIEERSP